MVKKTLKEEFYFLLSYKDEIEESSISLPFNDYNYIYKHNCYGIFVYGFLFILVCNKYFFYLFLKLLQYLIKVSGSYSYIIIPVLAFLLAISPIFLAFLIFFFNTESVYKKYFYLKKVFDFKNNALYTEKCVWGKIKRYDYIDFKDILIFCNNVLPKKYLPFVKGKRIDIKEITKNPDTNLFHEYWLSFLLKNGTMIDFLKLGYSENEYKTSINLAKALGQYLNKEYSLCDNNSKFISVSSPDSDDDSLYSLKEHMITEDDLDENEKDQQSEMKFLATVAGLIIAIIIIILSK